ncbi:hypothetical protein WH87_04730 [Devosia epidermidihirudinis]|uniref:Uncharacterized protein n=1 Tax=Devosia epidermidihirudinis TaxID=1293439 RepID=A0A0F5QEW3_9HYPH|nr:hypothetical protein [Devosia epidermidihirudinis]KKC39505.1 hypothetical protein WH87_04730 [Devosia epidermidihirudinis]
MEISGLKRDSAAIAAGQWVGDIPGLGDVRLRVRGLSSPVVVAVRSRRERKVPRDQRERDGSLTAEVGLVVFGEVLHEAVLLDWQGLTDGGKPVPFDADLAKTWLTDPDFAFFADAVVYAAQIVDKGNADTQEQLEGNYEAPLRGK